MRKWLMRAAAFFPIYFFVYFSMYAESIYIQEINLYFSAMGALRVLVLGFFAWNAILPIKKACKYGNLVEVAYYAVPVEVFLLLVFAQYHFWLSVILLLLLLFICILFFWWADTEYARRICKKKRWARSDDRCRKMKFRLTCRFAILGTGIVLACPSILAVFVYEMKQPFYAAEQKQDHEVLNDDKDNIIKTVQQMLEEDADLNSSLCNWNKLAITEKLKNLQCIVDFETVYLGIEPLRVNSRKLGLWIQGEYAHSQKYQIWIDIRHLQKDTFEDCCNTILHETFHVYQHYVIDSVDWEQVSDCLYYKQAKEWLDNSENYADGYDDYDSYYNQPLEADARAFAEKELKKYVSYIGEEKQT